jgi:hypothetical protein
LNRVKGNPNPNQRGKGRKGSVWDLPGHSLAGTTAVVREDDRAATRRRAGQKPSHRAWARGSGHCPQGRLTATSSISGELTRQRGARWWRRHPFFPPTAMATRSGYCGGWLLAARESRNRWKRKEGRRESRPDLSPAMVFLTGARPRRPPPLCRCGDEERNRRRKWTSRVTGRRLTPVLIE